jgi:hypothetical protein
MAQDPITIGNIEFVEIIDQLAAIVWDLMEAY